MTDKKVPDWLIERFAQNEPFGKLRAPEVPSEALQSIQASNAEILARYTAPQMAREIKRRASQAPAKKTSAQPWAYALVPAFAALFIAVWVGRGYLLPEVAGSQITEPAFEDTVAKGLLPKLQLYRQSGQLAERLAPNSKTKAGDTIQLSYNSAGKPFGVIVSIDGRGVVTRHLPEDGDVASKLIAGEVPLKHSYELDDAPRFECFYFITGDAPFAVDTVINSVNALRETTDWAAKPLQLPNGLSQSSIMIQKEPK
jgi:hypothetical protein